MWGNRKEPRKRSKKRMQVWVKYKYSKGDRGKGMMCSKRSGGTDTQSRTEQFSYTTGSSSGGIKKKNKRIFSGGFLYSCLSWFSACSFFLCTQNKKNTFLQHTHSHWCLSTVGLNLSYSSWRNILGAKGQQSWATEQLEKQKLPKKILDLTSRTSKVQHYIVCLFHDDSRVASSTIQQKVRIRET